jgi:uroporphyrinogen III methyltransferase / synthase
VASSLRGAVRVGRVFLVGAGPGDPGLFTIRGRELVRSADVIVYDRLVNPALLEEARGDALKLCVGKTAGAHACSQSGINALLVAHARRARRVVRLKGGDPFVFGRGGEEAVALAEARIPFEIVPGISAAVAVPASAGIPLTHRGLASSVAIMTGHEDADKRAPVVHWPELARAVDTLVVLMAATSWPRIVADLLAHGRSSATPVALIRWGTTAAQEVVIGSLGDIVDRPAARALAAPLVVVIGDVVGLRDRLQPGSIPGEASARGEPIDARSASQDRRCSGRRSTPEGGSAMRGLVLVSLLVIVVALGVLEVVASQRTAQRLGDIDLRPAPTSVSR